jgi:hypothetical protein
MLRKRQNECGDRRPVFGHGAYAVGVMTAGWSGGQLAYFYTTPHPEHAQRTNRIELNPLQLIERTNQLKSNEIK